MKQSTIILFILVLIGASGFTAADPVEVVTTLTDYASIAQVIGGDRVHVQSIMTGAADPHFLKPKPSYALMLRDADLFVATGLDLELWAPVVVNKSGNRTIVDGSTGYVSASHGITMKQVPTSLSRTGGDIHALGNPHIMTSPINAKTVATNITTGLCKVDAEGCDSYKKGLENFQNEISLRLYGAELIELLGTETLDALAANGRLVPFLEEKGLTGRLGGWLGESLAFRGKNIICYHKNWIYFTSLFGLNEVAYVEPKPGIPPNPRHVAKLIDRIDAENLEVLLTANYFEKRKPELIADRTGIIAVMAPLATGGETGVDTYFDLVDLWIDRLSHAFNHSTGESTGEKH